MGTYGPIALTPNSPVEQDIDATAGAVLILNDSYYDLLVDFGVRPPASTGGSQGDWQAVVLSGQHTALDIPADAYVGTPQGSVGMGKVWLLPLTTHQSNLVLNGSTSSTANLWIITAGSLNALPNIQQMASRGLDLTSQARVVAVPVTAGNSINIDTGTMAVGGVFQSVSLGVAVTPFVTTVRCYLYSFMAQQNAASTVWSRWRLGFAEYTNVNALIALHPVVDFLVTGTTGQAAPVFTPVVYAPSFPAQCAIQPHANCFEIFAYITLVGSAASAVSALVGSIQVDADNLNSIAVPSIGGGANKTISLIGPGVTF